MTKIFAASAYVAVMSFAIATESHSGSPRHAANASAKGDLGVASRPNASARSASLAQTGPNETTVTRSSGR